MSNLKKDIFKLSEREEVMKKFYHSGGQAFIKTPMTIIEYEKYLTDGRVVTIKDKYSNYYKSKTENKLGVTNENVEYLTEGRKIDIVLHPRYSIPIKHNHLYIEILYVYSGECCHFVENDSFHLKEGDLCFLAPSTLHALSVSDDATLVINIMVSKKLFDSLLIDILKGSENETLLHFIEQVLYNKNVSPYLLFNTKKDSYIKKNVIEMLKERYEELYKFDTNLYLNLVQLFIRIVRMYESLAKVPDNIHIEKKGNDSYIEAILAYITLNYNNITLQDTANFFGYDASHLGKKIKQYTGYNFATILSDLQVTNAKKMLESSSLSITEICNEVGCYDSSHLNKKFKAKYGKTPMQFRNTT